MRYTALYNTCHCGTPTTVVNMMSSPPSLLRFSPASYQHNGPSPVLPVLPVLFPGVREVEQRASGDLNPTDLSRRHRVAGENTKPRRDILTVYLFNRFNRALYGVFRAYMGVFRGV